MVRLILHQPTIYLIMVFCMLCIIFVSAQDGIQQQQQLLSSVNIQKNYVGLSTRREQIEYIPVNCTDPTHLTPEGWWDPKLPIMPARYYKPTIGHFAREYHDPARFANSEENLDKNNPNAMRYQLIELFKAWHKWTKENDIEWIVMHGALVGYYWGQQLLPWDSDLDFSIDYENAKKLSQFNQTIVDNTYIIDINPMWCSRQWGFGHDFIDMRFISMNTSLYIDITVLSSHVVENFYPQPFQPRRQRSYHHDCYVKDPLSRVHLNRPTNAINHLVLRPNPNVHCLQDKSIHTYRYNDIYPLKQTVFEGLNVNVPNNYENILKQEYYQYKLPTFHQGGNLDRYFDWNPKSQEWQLRKSYELVKLTKIIKERKDQQEKQKQEEQKQQQNENQEQEEPKQQQKNENDENIKNEQQSSSSTIQVPIIQEQVINDNKNDNTNDNDIINDTSMSDADKLTALFKKKVLLERQQQKQQTLNNNNNRNNNILAHKQKWLSHQDSEIMKLLGLDDNEDDSSSNSVDDENKNEKNVNENNNNINDQQQEQQTINDNDNKKVKNKKNKKTLKTIKIDASEQPQSIHDITANIVRALSQQQHKKHQKQTVTMSSSSTTTQQ